MDEGWINGEEAVQRYFLSDEQVTLQHPYTLAVYARNQDRYCELVVPGPHDYTGPMREAAAGWFGHFLAGRESTASITEPPLSPVVDRNKAISLLAFWPDGERPSDLLTPTGYVQRAIAGLVDQLPPAPTTLEQAQSVQADLRRRVGDLLRVSLGSVSIQMHGLTREQMGATEARKFLVVPEEGIELPMVLFSPQRPAGPSGELYVLLHPDGMEVTAGSREQQDLTTAGAWVLCVDLRGMGETRPRHESGGYLGFRDYDLCAAALKLGTTQAGLWVQDLLVAVAAARQEIGNPVRVVIRGDRETGLVGILAAGQSEAIDAVETTGLLASYASPDGYGLPYAYSGKDNDRSVTTRPLGGYGSMVPCIPHILRQGDVPQLAALVAPRPLTIRKPLWASGQPVPAADCMRLFAWTKQVYALHSRSDALKIDL